MMSNYDSEATSAPACRFCGTALIDTVVDLGMSPLCESYLRRDQLNSMELFYPLHVLVCRRCWLVQLEQYVSVDEIFTEYAYFSSFSDSWLQHAREYTENMIDRFGFDTQSHVVELASNDGYLLQWFVKAGVPALGIEPAANVARAAEQRGVTTLVRFFGTELANELVSQGKTADLLIGNNVLAQVPDLNDFVAGMKLFLSPQGIITLEVPHVQRLIADNQFDTIYHEHFSYFSGHTIKEIFNRHGLELFDVDELPTHGGSLRVYGRHLDDDSRPVEQRVDDLLTREDAFGITDIACYERFTSSVEATKRDILDLLIRLKREGSHIAGYGAPGKGNTLLNYCGIRTDLLGFTVDRSTYKQGMFTPGTHIPILDPAKIMKRKPDYVFILPWNFKEEIISQMACIREWGGQFIVPIPDPRIVP
jgi:hypothetical protein